MIDVMDTQFDKLTTKMDIFVDAIGTGNALKEKLSFIVERQVMTSRMSCYGIWMTSPGNWTTKWTSY